MARNGLKWYLAVNAATLDFEDYCWRDMIRVAVFTALINTNLRPHLIYDGPDDAFVAEMKGMGVTVIHRQTPLRAALQARAPGAIDWLNGVCGAFLRFEIPAIENEDGLVLYTDADVLFLKNPQLGTEMPLIFGATSQFSENPAEDMNSGVMLINVPNMRLAMPALMDFTYRSLDLGLDQEILRAFFGNNYLVLDRSLNWKPYWGWNPHAQIIHFHGPKPVAARDYLTEGKLPRDTIWRSMLAENRAMYEAHTRLWYLYLERLGSQQR